MVVDPIRGQIPSGERRSAHQVAVEREGRLDAAHHDLVERATHPGDGLVPMCTYGHDLGDHGVVVGSDPIARPDRGVHAHARARRHHPQPDATGRRRKGVRWILGGEAHFDRVADRSGRLRSRSQHARSERFAGRDPELLSHDVEARDELRDAMFDLQSRVDLEKPEPTVAVEQEFRRGRVVQPGSTCRSHREIVELRPLVGAQPGGR